MTARTAWWTRLMENVSRERCLVGASVFRFLSGLGLLWEYLGVYRQRHFFYGPQGIDSWPAFHDAVGHTSLYALSPSPVWFESVFHAGALVTLLWTMGWRTRFTTPLTFAFWFSMTQHASSLWDGGDNLMTLVLVYVCFANVSAYFSLDALRPRPAPSTRTAALGILHNAAMLAIALQLSIVYACAGLAKARGASWIDGTGLYYAMRSGEFAWPGWSELVFRRAWAVTLLSYCTVAFQLAFFFCVFLNKYTRRAIVCVSISFHLAIMTFMGLVSFGLFLMSADLALLGDEDYRGAWRFVTRTAGWIRSYAASRGFAVKARERVRAAAHIRL